MSAVQNPYESNNRKVSQIGSIPIRQRLGAALLAGVIFVVIALQLWPSPDPTPPPDQITVVKGYGGGLKVEFLSDPEVAKILEERYRLRVDIGAVGSVEIACDTPLGPEDDFVWLGDSVVLEMYKRCGGIVLANDNIYYSPIVFYSWARVVDALVAAGVAQIQADGSYSLDFAKLVTMIESGQTWESIGLSDPDGMITVQTSDPLRSNSGFLFAGLLANTLNGGSIVTALTVDPLLPRLQSYFQGNGYMPGRSADLWKNFLSMGMGAYPLVALIESQIIEEIVANPNQLAQINADIRLLYPEPTVWGTHPFVARTAEGEALMQALKDCDIQQLAADKHGQRPSVSCADFAPAVTGIRDQIPSAVGMPVPDVMDKIMSEIEAEPATPTSTPASSPVTTTNITLAQQSTGVMASRRRRRRGGPSHRVT
jgi:hypothetical protein